MVVFRRGKRGSSIQNILPSKNNNREPAVSVIEVKKASFEARDAT